MISTALACLLLAGEAAGASARPGHRGPGGGAPDLANPARHPPALPAGPTPPDHPAPPPPPFHKPVTALTPPMGWMSWNHFRCGTDPASPDAISEALVAAIAAGLAGGGFARAGYRTLSIDDCWQARDRDPTTGAVQADPVRFPAGLAGLGGVIRGFNLSFGLYGDVGPRTCAGFPANGGHFGADAAAMVAAGVSYFKADGCNAAGADLAALYGGLAAALADAARAAAPAHPPAIALSCSWPAYLPDARAVWASRHRGAHGHHGHHHHHHPLPPIPYAALAAACHAWRNWIDVDTSPASVAAIARYWAFAARFSPGFEDAPRPGAWHDPDELLVGEAALPYAWQALQFALWCAWGAPLFLSADVRGGGAAWPPGSRALSLHAELIAINQRGAGPARLVRCIGDDGSDGEGGGGGGGDGTEAECALQAWARPLAGGAVALVAANLGGGPPDARQVCVPVAVLVRTAGRVWGEGEGAAAAPPPRPTPPAALCWRPLSLAPRPTPVSSFVPWTEQGGFPRTAAAGDRLCLAVPAAGDAAVVVGRPCERGEREGEGVVASA